MKLIWCTVLYVDASSLCLRGTFLKSCQKLCANMQTISINRTFITLFMHANSWRIGMHWLVYGVFHNRVKSHFSPWEKHIDWKKEKLFFVRASFHNKYHFLPTCLQTDQNALYGSFDSLVSQKSPCIPKLSFKLTYFTKSINLSLCSTMAVQKEYKIVIRIESVIIGT